MKIEETSLTRYLVKSLQPLTEADPALLANYVVALLRNNKPKKELQKLCIDELRDFLGDGTKSFVSNLFHALEEGSIVTLLEEIEGSQVNEAQTNVGSGGLSELRSSSPPAERLPSAAVCVFNELEEKEISDDDDDDRNHKHRRRITRSHSFDRDSEGDNERRPNRKRGRHLDNGQSLQESESQFSNHRREYTPSQNEREINVKYDRRRHGSLPSSRLNVDGGQKGAKGNQTYCNDSSGRFDGQNLFSRAGLGRGRGRSTVAWAPHDTRFTSVETVDFTSTMPPQGTTSVNLYPGTGRAIPSSANSANPSWNAFGMIPGIPSVGLEQLHPLHARMQGGRGASMNATIGIGIGMGRPRCRDFEERGFCLRGDMCPMEHGLNRIVVEDVQSLSQFNLPVSLPSGHLLGMKSGAVGGHSSAIASSLSMSSKSSYGKNTKYHANEGTAQLNGIAVVSAENEPDFYDPDQPLWNKDCSGSSHRVMQLPSPRKGSEEHLWNDNSSDRHSCRLSDGDNERPVKSAGTGSHGAVASVWGRIGPIDPAGNRSGVNRKGDASGETLQHGKQSRKQVYDEQHSHGCGSRHQGDSDIEKEGYADFGSKDAKLPLQQGKLESSVIPGLHRESGSHLTSGLTARVNASRGSRGKGTERAVRTLFVNCVPLQSNRGELLLAHFQKFGEVLDIHIPKNSERAFVQFRHRESAEAALSSPDAVMGNRFIRLSWANRDSILVGGESSVTTGLPDKISCGGKSASHSQQIQAEKVKEKVFNVASAVSGISISDVPSTETSAVKSVSTNDVLTPSISKVQKKQEKLELLEELRRKQEMLAQKRDSFRRQLDKLAKQGMICRSDALDMEQGGQQQKTDPTTESAHLNKSCNTRLQSSTGADPGLDVENSSVKVNCGDVPNPVAGPSLISSAMVSHPSPKAFKLPFPRFPRLAPPHVFGPNRFKLDNRPTAFKILPPLPAGLMDIAVLKEHFSAFGDLSSVEFDDIECHVDEANKMEKLNVRVTYTSRRAAERAFSHGKSWQGQNLQLAWLMPANTTFSQANVENAAFQTSKGFSNGAIAAEKEAHHGAPGLEKESSGVVQVENEAFDGKEVRENGARSKDSSAEVSKERCGLQVKNLDDEGIQSDPTQCSTPQFQTNTVAAKLDGNGSNASSFAQTDIPTEVL